MKLLERLHSDLLGDAPLSTTLRTALVLAFRLHNEPLKQWVERELNGYRGRDDQLPDYRVFMTHTRATFTDGYRIISGAQVPIFALPEELRDPMHTMRMDGSTREIESMIDAARNTEGGLLTSPWPTEALALISHNMEGRVQCLAAGNVIAPQQLYGILEAVKNRLLQLILELEEQYPQAAEVDFKVGPGTLPSDQVTHTVQAIIYGDNTTVQAGQGDRYHVSDVQNTNMALGSNVTDSTQRIGE